MSIEQEHQIEAVLFDLDGVIVFTDRYHYLGWKRLADENGWAFDEEINNGCRGVPRMESLEVILRHNGVDLPEDEKEALASRKNAYYVDLLADINEADVYPGAVEFLKRLRSTGVKIALCSSSKNAPLVLESLGLEEYFDAVVTGADIRKAKPDPEIFLLGASRVGVEPGKCVVFEDAPSGVAGALAAGMSCVGVGSPELLDEAPVVIQEYNTIDIDKLLGAALLREEVPQT
jgi:beta-phosphoglucomutase